MRTTLLILVLVFGINFSYSQNEKKVLTDFGVAITNNKIKLVKIIDSYINYDKRAKEITLLQLQSYRNDWNKNPKDIIVYSYEEAMAKGKGYKIVSTKYDRVFFILMRI